MRNLKRGYTLLEVMVVMGIISLLLSGIGIGYWNFKEKMELEEAKIGIITGLGTYRDRAYYNHRSYTLFIDTSSKYIEIWEDSIGGKRERIELPKNLRYKIPGKNSILTKINPNGNLGDAFTLYIFGKDRVAKYRLGFYTFLQLKYLKINLYRNISAHDAIWGNIDKYHETSGAKNLQGWELVK